MPARNQDKRIPEEEAQKWSHSDAKKEDQRSLVRTVSPGSVHDAHVQASVTLLQIRDDKKFRETVTWKKGDTLAALSLGRRCEPLPCGRPLAPPPPLLTARWAQTKRAASCQSKDRSCDVKKAQPIVLSSVNGDPTIIQKAIMPPPSSKLQVIHSMTTTAE